MIYAGRSIADNALPYSAIGLIVALAAIITPFPIFTEAEITALG
ncbi:MAG: hypothetical protein WDO16_01080 [Bacteroidota bacterium]